MRDIKAAPEPAIVMASDRQLDDLVRFCGTPSGAEGLILTVDPTFSLGDFECTAITYRHLLLVSHRYSTSPIFIGPVLNSLSKELWLVSLLRFFSAVS